MQPLAPEHTPGWRASPMLWMEENRVYLHLRRAHSGVTVSPECGLSWASAVPGPVHMWWCGDCLGAGMGMLP